MVSRRHLATRPEGPSLLLYISGPISGLAPGVARSRFTGADNLLTAIGFRCLDPHSVAACTDNSCGGYDDDDLPGDTYVHSWECYLRYDLIEMLKCDGVALLDGWEESRGARLEYNTAKELAIEIHKVDWWMNHAHLNDVQTV